MPELMKGNRWHERCDAKDRKGNPIVTYPVYVEDKHDEIRCHVKVMPRIGDHVRTHEVQYLSYAGKPLANMQRFDDAFVLLSERTGWSEFDLGFEVNRNFNDSYRWVRSTRGVPDDLKDAKFKFLVFGLPEFAGTDNLMQQFARRIEAVTYALDWVSTQLAVPMWTMCTDERDVEAAFSSARTRGLEGVMVKQPLHLYERKRTDGWLKMKPEAEADGIITELHEAICGKDQPDLGLVVGDHLGRIGSVTVKIEDGSTASPHGIPHDLGTEMFLNPQAYIGEWCEFNYMERDRQGGYRHPTFRRLREAKA